MERQELSIKEREQITSKRIYEARKRKGYSIAELASLTGISAATLQRYEVGKIKNMSLDTLRTVATALDVDPIYLFGMSSEDVPLEKSMLLDRLFSKIGYSVEYRPLDDIYVAESNDDIIQIAPSDMLDLYNTTVSFFSFKFNETKNKSNVFERIAKDQPAGQPDK